MRNQWIVGLAVVFLLQTGCAQFLPNQNGQQQASEREGLPPGVTHTEKEAPPEPPQLHDCEPEDGEERSELMPPGTYDGSNDQGSGTMWMRDDHTLRVQWTDQFGQESTVEAEFLWLEGERGEAIELCEIKHATPGELMEPKGSSSTVVLGIDEENHGFRFNVPEIGEVEFTRVED